jgi:hypothetical protein
MMSDDSAARYSSGPNSMYSLSEGSLPRLGALRKPSGSNNASIAPFKRSATVEPVLGLSRVALLGPAVALPLMIPVRTSATNNAGQADL